MCNNCLNSQTPGRDQTNQIIEQKYHLLAKQNKTGDGEGGIAVPGLPTAATLTQQAIPTLLISCPLINHLLMAQMGLFAMHIVFS